MKPKCSILAGILGATAIVFCCCGYEYAASQSAPFHPQGAQSTNESGQVQGDVNFNTFYNALKPYGNWENDAMYGEVWVCTEAGFIPYYTSGNWVYSTAGWAWSSTYPWGWAPFHYGRWVFTNRWLWVPGYEWAPAWVSWRGGAGYYGWAPLAPGMGISTTYSNYMPASRWVFCRKAYINNPDFSKYCASKTDNLTIITNTTVDNNITVYHNTRFFAGPDRQDAEKYTGTKINPVAVHITAGAARNAGLTQIPAAPPKNAGTTQHNNPNGRATRHAVYNKNRPLPMRPHANKALD